MSDDHSDRAFQLDLPRASDPSAAPAQECRLSVVWHTLSIVSFAFGVGFAIGWALLVLSPPWNGLTSAVVCMCVSAYCRRRGEGARVLEELDEARRLQ